MSDDDHLDAIRYGLGMHFNCRCNPDFEADAAEVVRMFGGDGMLVTGESLGEWIRGEAVEVDA